VAAYVIRRLAPKEPPQHLAAHLKESGGTIQKIRRIDSLTHFLLLACLACRFLRIVAPPDVRSDVLFDMTRRTFLALRVIQRQGEFDSEGLVKK